MRKGFITGPVARGWKRLSPNEVSSPSLEVCEQGPGGCSGEPGVDTSGVRAQLGNRGLGDPSTHAQRPRGSVTQ